MPPLSIPDVFLDDKTNSEKLETLYEGMVQSHAQIILNESVGKPVDERHIEGQAALRSLFSSMNWANLGDAFFLFAISKIEETGSWKDIKVSNNQLYDTFQDYLEEVFERDIQNNRGKSEVSNWRFMIGWVDRNGLKHRGLIDIFRSQGKPLSKIVEMFKLGTKWRESISQMRQIEREFANNPDEAARRIVALVEEQVLNPNVILGDIRAAAPNYRGGVSVNQIPAETTGYYMTGSNGAGMMVIPVENKSQAFAVQSSLKGVIANSDRSFFPRDALSGDLGREVKNMLTQGPMDVLRRRISDEVIMDMIVSNDLKVILPVTLIELEFQTLSEVLGTKLSAVVGETYATAYLWRSDAVVGFLGAEIHIRMKADTDNSTIRVKQ
jgi:hypothetical protein